MSMFDTVGKEATEAERDPNTKKKVERVLKALQHEEPDRVPITDFFWGGFIRRWQDELGLPEDANPYYHYDLDMIVTVHNMDPHIKNFETVREDDEEVVVKTGFETTLRKRFDLPMPEQESWDVDTLEKLEAFEFDDAQDPRRFFSAGDNQIAGVGDGFSRNSLAWLDTVNSLRPDFAVFGSCIEAAECLTRLIGQMNMFMWMGEEPERFGKQVLRIGEFYYQCAKAAMDAADGLLDGFLIWGDVAYGGGMFFSPDYWRTYFKPAVQKIINEAHSRNLPVMYHGCGNVKQILPDFIDMGLDAYNPLEAKAGMDVCELRAQYGHQLGFFGNSNMQVWEEGDPEKLKHEVLRKLTAARGGGMIFASDHSVSSSVSGHTYDMIVKLVREHGNYPLQLKEYSE